MSGGGREDGKALPLLIATEADDFFFALSNLDQFRRVLNDPYIAGLPVTVIGWTSFSHESINLLNYFIPALQAMESGTELDHYDFSNYDEEVFRYDGTSRDQVWSRPFVVTIDGQRRVVVLVRSDQRELRSRTSLSYMLASANILAYSAVRRWDDDEDTVEGETIIVRERREGDDRNAERLESSFAKLRRYPVAAWFHLPKRGEQRRRERETSEEYLDCIRQLLKRALKETKTVGGKPLTCGQLAECLQCLVALFQRNRYPNRDAIKEAMQRAVQHYTERFRVAESEAERQAQDARWRAGVTSQVLDQTGVVAAAAVNLMGQLNRVIDAGRRRPVQAVEQGAQQQEQPQIPGEQITRITGIAAVQMSEEDHEAMITRLEREQTLLRQQWDVRQSELDGICNAMEKADLETKRTIQLTSCWVCKERPFEVAFLPCYHCICRQCADMVKDNVCPTCGNTTTGLEEL